MYSAASPMPPRRPRAVRQTAASNSVDRRHMMLECISQGITFESEDKRERMTRFLERKKAKEERGDG